MGKIEQGRHKVCRAQSSGTSRAGWEMGLWDPQAGEKSLGSPGMEVEPPTLILLQP